MSKVIKLGDIEILENEPFKNDKLDREKYADTLTQLINTYADGFVLAHNNEWGTGKSTFVRMWEQKLKNDGYTTIHFNAWENDFDSNPMVAILSEIKEVIGEGNKTLKSVLKIGSKVGAAIIPALVGAVAAKYIDKEALKEGLKAALEAGADIFTEEIDDYVEKKKGLEEFRDELTKLASEIGKDKPIVFIVDELDRCRPDYAVHVLEIIKHFFSVPKIVFVLSIDKEQLGYAVEGVYNSANINSTEYLRRFIDVEYTLPQPNPRDFCEFLYDQFGFKDFFDSGSRRAVKMFRGDKRSFLDFANTLTISRNMTLREQEKLLAQVHFVLNLYDNRHKVFPDVLLYLLYMKHYNVELFNDIRYTKLVVTEFLKANSEIMKKMHFEDKEARLALFQLEAHLLVMYNNYIDYSRRVDLEKVIDGGMNSITSNSFGGTPDRNHFSSLIRSILNNLYVNPHSLEYLLNKIDLAEPIKSY